MTTDATTLPDYLKSLPKERVEPMRRLRDIAHAALVPGFEETVGYVGINYVVPLRRFPAGYHCTPGEALPFVTLASQAKHIAVYHMGIYGDPALLEWFTTAYAKAGVGKLNMGKSCIRFTKVDAIPYDLLGDLLSRMSVDDWIAAYERSRPVNPKK